MTRHRPALSRCHVLVTVTQSTGCPFVIDHQGGDAPALPGLIADLWGGAFGGFVSSDVKRWAEVVKASGAKPD